MKLTAQLGILSAANIGIAFLFQLCVLSQLGPGPQTDALFAGMTMPQLVLTVISGSLMHVLVPLFSGAEPAQLKHDSWAMLTLVGSVFGVLAVGLYMAAPVWVPFMVPGFDDAAKELTVTLTRIQLVGMIFTALNGVQWAVYHARHQFIWAELGQVAVGLFAIGLLYVSLPRYGIVAAAWINTARMMLQTLLLSPGMGAPVLPDLRANAVRAVWGRIRPLLLGTLYYKTDPVVDRFLLSSANSGSLSLYYLAQQIYSAANQVINKAITAPMVPVLSKMYKTGNVFEFFIIYRKNLVMVGVLSIAGVVLLIAAGQPILRILIGHHNIQNADIAQLWWIMLYLGGMFMGMAMGQITSSTFYASGDTVTPVKLSAISYTVYIPTKIVVYSFYGIAGLAIVTSVYQMVNLLLQMWYLNRRRSSLRDVGATAACNPVLKQGEAK